ncbi:MAG: sulfatase-like hydrolase/transferase [Chloroflexi bacterium]|nr:sulfatase-like hydrolase/transferase [Chloroflexota bacterium]
MSWRAPNVVVFFTDQQRWDTMGLHGNPLGLTPNLDRMAQRGTHVVYGLTPQPLCTPARACLQTGQWQTRTGVYTNGQTLPPTTKTLAHYFGEAGYATAYIGKWHLATTNPVPATQRGGYHYWLGSNGLMRECKPYRTIVYDNDDRPVTLPGYRVDALTDAAIRWIDARQERPFFLFLSHIEPHQQQGDTPPVDDYHAPDGYRERYEGRWVPPDLAALGGTAHQYLGGYYGSVKRLDEALGRLLDALKSLDLLENTIVLYTADHSDHFHTRNDGCKRSIHEASIRVPMVLQGGEFDGGGHVRQPVTLLDLPPTLLDAAGIPVPAEMQGRSLMPVLRRQSAEWLEDALIMVSTAQVARGLRTHRWKYSVDAPTADPRRDSTSAQYVEEYLYDLHADPHELTNLVRSPAHAEVRDQLRRRLIERLREAGDVVPEIEPAPASATSATSALRARPAWRSE